jgi:hypothetical protein
MANPGKSAELKAKLGSREGATQVQVFEADGQVPMPPRRLEESGLELWRNAWTLGWISKTADYTALAILCERMDERDILVNWMLGNPDDWRQRAALRKLEDSIESSMRSLILTPEARLKAGVAEAKTKTKLEELLAKRSER